VPLQTPAVAGHSALPTQYLACPGSGWKKRFAEAKTLQLNSSATASDIDMNKKSHV